MLLTDTCGEALAETSFLPEVDEWSDLNLAGDELVGEAGDPGVSLRSLQCEIRLDYKVSEVGLLSIRRSNLHGEEPLVDSPDLLREFCRESPVPI